MSVLNELAVSYGRRDEVPNKELALRLVKSRDNKAIRELVVNLQVKKYGSDIIKVLYEIAERSPELIAPFCKEILPLLHHKNNRMVWGAMAALNYITSFQSALIFKNLDEILEVCKKGTVITRDQTVNILIGLSSIDKYKSKCMRELMNILHISPINQLPSYAEKIGTIITNSDEDVFIHILTTRLPELEKESARKRVEKAMKLAMKNGIKK